jgi:hypothetical protein
MTADSAARLAATRLSEQGALGASTTRASTANRLGEMADVLRAMGRQLLALAELFAEPIEPAPGQALGSDDELSPALEARLDAAASRHRRRAKQPHGKQQTRRRSAQ